MCSRSSLSWYCMLRFASAQLREGSLAHDAVTMMMVIMMMLVITMMTVVVVTVVMVVVTVMVMIIGCLSGGSNDGDGGDDDSYEERYGQSGGASCGVSYDEVDGDSSDDGDAGSDSVEVYDLKYACNKTKHKDG